MIKKPCRARRYAKSGGSYAHYNYPTFRKAAAICTRVACQAGIMPARRPTARETARPRAAVVRVTTMAGKYWVTSEGKNITAGKLKARPSRHPTRERMRYPPQLRDLQYLFGQSYQK